MEIESEKSKLMVVVDGIIGVAMFKMFSSYGCVASLDNLFMFLAVKQAEI